MFMGQKNEIITLGELLKEKSQTLQNKKVGQNDNKKKQPKLYFEFKQQKNMQTLSGKI